MKGYGVAGEPAPVVVAGHRRLDRRGVFLVGRPDERGRRQDVGESRHQRRVRGGVIYEAKA